MWRTIIFSFIITVLFSATAYAGTYGIVTGSRVNVRAYADVESNNRLFQVDRGTRIRLNSVDGDFFTATIGDDCGVYIARDFVRVTQTQGYVTAAPFARVYSYPGGDAFSFITNGETITVRYVYENFFGIDVDGTIAFASQSGIEIPYFAELPAARIGGALANEIIRTAKNYLGTRYLWGGTTPRGFDCSGFMLYVFTQHGIHLNRSSREQVRNGFPVTRTELIPGDLLFFGSGNHINHVGMYIGNNEYIHSSSNLTGGVIITNLNTCHYSARSFITARRVI